MYTRAHPFHSGKGGTRQHHHVGERKNVPATKKDRREARKKTFWRRPDAKIAATDRRKRFERKLCEKSKKIGGHTSHIARGVEQERSEQTSVDIIALITLIQQEDPSFTIEEI